MKKSVLVALAMSLASVSAGRFDLRDEILRELERRALETREPFLDTTSTTNNENKSGPGGRSGAASGGSTGPIGGDTAGKQKNKQSVQSTVGNVSTDASRSQNGITTGSSGGSAVTNTNNSGGVGEFITRKRLFDGPGGPLAGANIHQDNSQGAISTGGDSSNRGDNNAQIGGYSGKTSGGSQRGSADARGKKVQKAGNAKTGRGGDSREGGGNTNHGGDARMSLDFSPTLSVPGKRRRALEARSMELEDEYLWVQQQKRDLDNEELIARFADESLAFREAKPDFEFEDEHFEARSEEPEAEMFYSRGAEFDSEDYFQGLIARDLLKFYGFQDSEY